ncbi:MAG: cobalamin-dependent protein, partial [Thermoanaerobaculia bacterium]
MLDPGLIDQMAVEIADAQLRRMPELAQRYGSIGRRRCIEDTTFHLRYLDAAVTLDDATLFGDYIAWAKVMLASRGVGENDLLENLHEIRAALLSHALADAAAVVDTTIATLATMPAAIPSFLTRSSRFSDVSRDYLREVLAGRRLRAEAILEQAIAGGATLQDLYLEIFEPVQHEIGRLWQVNEITIAQEHFCTAAVQRSISGLYAKLFVGSAGRRRVVAACAGRELHEIGLRMVTDLLELNGWDTVYLGANIPIESVVRTVAEAPTALVAISVTITPHLASARELIDALRASPRTRDVPVIAGGYPFRLSNAIAARLGADAWAVNASDAVIRA